jgi:hypothetical protein
LTIQTSKSKQAPTGQGMDNLYCISNILAIPIGSLAKTTDLRYGNGAEICRICGVVMAEAVGIPVLIKLGSPEDK